MSIKLPIVNVNGINWRNHKDFYEMLSEKEIIISDIAVIESKSECPLPLGDDEYCIIIDKDVVFTEKPFTKEECKLLFGVILN